MLRLPSRVGRRVGIRRNDFRRREFFLPPDDGCRRLAEPNDRGSGHVTNSVVAVEQQRLNPGDIIADGPLSQCASGSGTNSRILIVQRQLQLLRRAWVWIRREKLRRESPGGSAFIL